MGRVFTWNERCCGIPSLADFDLVVRRIKCEVEQTDSILGAIIFGSVAFNTHNQRSDVDCLVIYKDQDSSIARRAFHRLYNYSAAGNIPLELVTMSKSAARSPYHSLSSSLAQNLQYTAEKRGFIKANPLSVITTRRQSADSQTWDYFGWKIARLEKIANQLLLMGEEDICRSLQTVWEAPIHLIRKLLYYSRIYLQDHSKEAVLASFRSLSTNEEELDLLVDLVKSDERYTDDLKRDRFSCGAYQDKCKASLVIDCEKALRLAHLLLQRL